MEKLYTYIKFKLNTSFFLYFMMNLFKKFVRILFIWILFVRSFFIKDKTILFISFILPAITGIFIYLANTYPQIYSAFSSCKFLIFLGFQLISYDVFGDKISFHILKDPNHLICETSLLAFASNRKNPFVGFISSQAIQGILIGKTAMTATGRATLIAGVSTGLAWLYNEHQNRNALNSRAEADRVFNDARAQADRAATAAQAQANRVFNAEQAAKTRAYTNFQDAKKTYDNTPFSHKKGEKPSWDESKWDLWTKSK